MELPRGIDKGDKRLGDGLSMASERRRRMRMKCFVSKLRTAKGWTQSELAGRVGIRQNTLSEIERETKRASLTTALLLAQALECNVSEIFAIKPLKSVY